MANTTWNPSDKSAGITLSGGNLIATAAGTVASVRAFGSQIAGKFYWEFTATTAGSTNDFGFVHGGYPLGQHLTGGSSAGACAVEAVNGGIYVNGVYSGVALGSVTSGAVVCFAIDLDAQRLWARLGAAGNWNNAAGNNPATGAGGLAMPFGRLLAVYPAWYAQTTPHSVTANFGDSAFAGSVPSGFTAGFPINSLPVIGGITQLGVEQWGQGAPVAQVTQTALEVWGGITAGPRSALVTQLAVEQWAPVAAPPPTAAQYAVTVNSS